MNKGLILEKSKKNYKIVEKNSFKSLNKKTYTTKRLTRKTDWHSKHTNSATKTKGRF